MAQKVTCFIDFGFELDSGTGDAAESVTGAPCVSEDEVHVGATGLALEPLVRYISPPWGQLALQ